MSASVAFEKSRRKRYGACWFLQGSRKTVLPFCGKEEPQQNECVGGF